MTFQNSATTVPAPSIFQPQSATNQIVFQVSRNVAYYLEAIPPPSSQSTIWFDWNVTIIGASYSTGSIQFSQNNLTWSNLLAFTLVSGVAQGRQHIDLSWARPGSNYLRASYNQSLSSMLDLVVFVNYYTTVLLILSPFFTAVVLTLAVYLLRGKKSRPIAPTM